DGAAATAPARVLLRIARGAVDVATGRERLTLRAGEQVALVAGRPPLRETAYVADLPRPLLPPEMGVEEPVIAAPAATPPPRGFGTLDGREPRSGHRSRAISLAQAKVNVTIRDGFARTEVDERFYNSSGQRLEGTYRFPIPRGAVLARLQLEVDGVLRDSAVLERQRARQIFETVVDEMLDPALAEWSGASQVKLRIFPIEPHQSRRVVLTYVQPLRLEGDRFRYVFPMAAARAQATAIGRLAIGVDIAHAGGIAGLATPLADAEQELTPAGGRVRASARSFVPADDFVVEFRPRTRAPAVRFATAVVPAAGGQPTQGFFFAALHPRLPAAAAPARLDYVILVDTSHAMAPEHLATARASAAALIASLDAQDRFALLACDSFCARYGDGLGPADEERRQGALAFLRGRTPGGATDLERALGEAARLLPAGGGGRIVYVGPGTAAAGELDRPRLVQRAGATLAAARARLLVLGVGADVDELFLDALARRTGGRARYLASGDEADRAAWELVAAELRPALERAELSLTTPGTTDVFPGLPPTIVDGDDLFVVGRFTPPGGAGDIVLKGDVGGQPFQLVTPVGLGGSAGGGEALGRLWAKQRIDQLLAEDDGAEGPRRREVIALSTRYGLVTPYTSMLVLENAEMERRFGVHSRRRLTGAGEQLALKDGDAVSAEAEAADKSAGLGTIGDLATKGGGGGAAGRGSSGFANAPGGRIATGAPATAAPAPAMAKPAEERAEARKEKKGAADAPRAVAAARPGWGDRAAAEPAPAAPAKMPAPRPAAQTAAPLGKAAPSMAKPPRGAPGLDDLLDGPSVAMDPYRRPRPIAPPPPPSATFRAPGQAKFERVDALTAQVRARPLARASRR
ncbi:MAG TPA: VIT and VWA domain-containing protein, partial [Polyangia bacterium]